MIHNSHTADDLKLDTCVLIADLWFKSSPCLSNDTGLVTQKCASHSANEVSKLDSVVVSIICFLLANWCQTYRPEVATMGTHQKHYATITTLVVPRAFGK